MTSPPPSIRDFPTFETELAEALELLDAHISRDPDNPAYVYVRRQVLDVKNFTAEGRCPTDEEIGRTTFGMFAAHELHDHPELARVLSRLANYLDQWPRGVRAPSWHEGRPAR
jgi:hypothetical protein